VDLFRPLFPSLKNTWFYSDQTGSARTVSRSSVGRAAGRRALCWDVSVTVICAIAESYVGGDDVRPMQRQSSPFPTRNRNMRKLKVITFSNELRSKFGRYYWSLVQNVQHSFYYVADISFLAGRLCCKIQPPSL